jgi:hypothetical protein
VTAAATAATVVVVAPVALVAVAIIRNAIAVVVIAGTAGRGPRALPTARAALYPVVAISEAAAA